MDGDLQNLPDDAETLKAMIADMRRSQSSLQAEVAALRAAGVDAQARIDRLQLLLKTIQRATYGRSSEKLDESQYAFTFEEVQTGLGAVDAMLQKLSPTPPRKSGGRRPLPAHLERVEEIIEPDDQPCSCGACARVKIGEDVSERLDVVAEAEGAIELGFRYIETDLHVTRDGVIVCFHDDTLDRTTDGVGFVEETPVATLRGLDAGSHFSAAFAGEPLPQLDAIFALIGRVANEAFDGNPPALVCEPGRALEQIQARGYHQKYAGQPVTLIGMEFSRAERNLTGFEWRRLDP